MKDGRRRPLDRNHPAGVVTSDHDAQSALDTRAPTPKLAAAISVSKTEVTLHRNRYQPAEAPGAGVHRVRRASGCYATTPPARSWAVIEGVAEHLKDDHRRSLTTVAESGRYPALTQPQRRTAVPPEGLANHNHRGADVHPAIEINCVHVAHTDAARRNVPANFRRLVRAVDADERVAIVNEKI
jgi:hypothetical protein